MSSSGRRRPALVPADQPQVGMAASSHRFRFRPSSRAGLGGRTKGGINMRLRAGTTIFIIFLAGALVVCTIPILTANLARAQEQAPEQSQCDFLTGGGFIIHDGAQANFGVAGGCKHGSPTWGHLEYIDHGT